MTHKNNTRIQLGHLLALIPIGVALGFLLGILDPPLLRINDTSLLLASLGTCILYGVSVYLAQSVKAALWMGYIQMAVTIALFTAGIANALYIIILASSIAVLIQHQVSRLTTVGTINFGEIAGWISISGIAVLIEYIIYTSLFKQTLPYTTLTVESLFFVVVTVGIGNAFSVVIGSIVTAQSLSKSVQRVIDNHPPLFELLLIFVAAIIAVTLYQVNELTFAIIIGFTIAQVIYEHRTSQLRRESANRLQELSTLNSVAQAVSVNLELDDVLRGIHDEINRLVNATLIFVALYDHEHQRVDYPLVMKEGKPIAWQKRHLANGLTDYVIRHKQSLYIRRSETERLESLEIDLDRIESKAYLGIPMMVGEKIIGVIGILNHHEAELLGETSLNVLQSIANQASLALRNATLYDRTTKLAKNLSLINQSVQEVMFNLEYNEALLAAAKTARSVVNADQIAIFLVNMQDTPSVRLVQSLGLSPAFEAKLEEATPNWFSNNAEEYQIVYDVDDSDDEFVQELAHIGGFRAFAEIPMRSGNTIVGYLLIYHQQPHNYHSPEIDLLEMLSNQITVALDNTDLLQALELYASEQAELIHLSSISSSSLELEKVITDVSQALRRILKVIRVDVGLHMTGRGYIHVYMPQESGHLQVKEYELQQYPEFNIETTNLLRYPQIILQSDESISDNLREYMKEHDCGMLTIAPMIINDEVIGILLVCDNEERIFKDNERRLIEMANTQIAAQIHNAQIHTLTEEALVQRLEQLSLIEDIGQKISRSLDLDLIISNVLEAAMRSTQADLASIALIKDEETVQIKTYQQRDFEVVSKTFERPISRGIIGQIMRTGVMRVIGDNHEVEEYVSLYEETYRSSLAVPLSKGDTIIGVLNVESVHPHFFTDEHAGFIKSLAGHAIISIDNATLLDEHQKQIEVLSQLRELALTASTTTSIDSITNTIIHTAADMFKGSGGILIPYNYEKKEIESTSTLGWIRLGENFVQDMFFIPDTLLYQVAHTEEHLFLENVHAHERYKSYEQINQVNYASIVIMPIKRRTKVTELLCITFKSRRNFSKQDYNTMELLQVQVANHLENVRLSAEVHESNVRMRAILDSTRDGIILLDREGNLQDANTSAEDLLNIELSSFRNESFATVLMNHSSSANDDESFAELIQTARILRTDPERNMIREYTMHSDGKLIYIREVSSPVWNASNEIIGRLLSLRDVTEERALEDFRSRLQSMIVHDLKGPLSAIVSSMVLGEDILKQSKEPHIVEDLSQLMQVAQESSSNLMDLVESMLDIGKLRRKVMNLNTTAASIQDIAENAYTTLLASFKEANIELAYDIADNVSDVYVDEGLIRRVFVNLIQNALKFTPDDGEIRITAQVDENRDDLIRVMVSDTGPGIPEEHRDRIFGEFSTIDNSAQKQERGPRGQGLGLTFCKLAVEEHGGHIWIADEGPLPGATFVFTLPRVLHTANS